MQVVRLRQCVRVVSRRIHRADLAVSTEAAVLLNLAPFHPELDLSGVLERAVDEPGAVFIGVVLLPKEVGRLVREVGLVLPNVTGPLGGRRLRRRG